METYLLKNILIQVYKVCPMFLSPFFVLESYYGVFFGRLDVVFESQKFHVDPAVSSQEAIVVELESFQDFSRNFCKLFGKLLFFLKLTS